MHYAIIYDCSADMTKSIKFHPGPGIVNPGIIDDLFNTILSNYTPQLKRTMGKLLPV